MQIHPLVIGLIITCFLGLLGLVWAFLKAEIKSVKETATVAHDKAIQLESRVAVIEAACISHKQELLTPEKLSEAFNVFKGEMSKDLDARFLAFADNFTLKLLKDWNITPIKASQKKGKG